MLERRLGGVHDRDGVPVRGLDQRAQDVEIDGVQSLQVQARPARGVRSELTQQVLPPVERGGQVHLELRSGTISWIAFSRAQGQVRRRP
jgi:hypothetical protein